jgi:glycosyltransferase involved in cell wall biosynthesis
MNFSFGIITGGNSDNYIQTIIDSIRNQTIPLYEIIIIGQTDISGSNITNINFY